MKSNWFVALLFTVIIISACDGNGKDTGAGAYVIEVRLQTFEAKRSHLNNAAGTERVERDTVGGASPLDAYSKGLQKYAAVLLDVHRNGEETRASEGELAVFDALGNDIIATIVQEQRDSVMMNFIHFARRATIPYYDHVKDFELKLMAVR